MNETAELIRHLLELERHARGGITWAALAKEFHVHTTTLWKWRNGRELGHAAESLIPLVKKHCTCDHHSSTDQPA